jgi:hypothetical protein
MHLHIINDVDVPTRISKKRFSLYFMKSMTEAAKMMGLFWKDSYVLVSQTFEKDVELLNKLILTPPKWIESLPQKKVLKEQFGYKNNNNDKNLI